MGERERSGEVGVVSVRRGGERGRSQWSPFVTGEVVGWCNTGVNGAGFGSGIVG